MPYSILRALGLMLVLAGATPVLAQDDTEQPAFPTTQFDASTPGTASVTAGTVSATVTIVAPSDPDAGDLPVLTVSVDGVKVAEATGTETDFNEAAEASIAEIDPDNDYPEVYFVSYSGGAHCCTTVIVAEQAGKDWVTVPVGDFDGDGGYLTDIDKDGLAEIVTVDNRFLYQFDSYAASAAPLVIYSVRGGAVVDQTTDPRYLAAHRDWLNRIEETVAPKDRWKSPGFLAGWVAERIRLGEGTTAWEELNANWDLTSDPGEPVCLTGGEPEDCAADQLKTLKFPERLRRFLTDNGYDS